MAGTLIIIGGHEDREGEKIILREVVRRADRRRIVVVGTASEEPEALFEQYRKAFADLGAKDVFCLDVHTRAEALSDGAADPIKNAGAVFFTGGDQLKLTSQIGDTPVFQLSYKVYEQGGVIAGTSAGASVLSDTMLVSGEGDASPKAGDALRMAPGFGFIHGVVVDQHFAERGRMGRLLAAVAQNPKSVGLGIDENSAVVVERSRFRVIGEGGVYVLDGAGVTYSSVAEADDKKPLSIHDVKIHVLAPGDRFDLNPRRPFLPAEPERS